MSHELVGFTVAGEVDAWEDIGFVVAGGVCRIGGVVVGFDGAGVGISSLTFEQVDPVTLDGIPLASGPAEGVPAPSHPNGVVGVDHLVIRSPDLARTGDALANAGFEVRRSRDTTTGGVPTRQIFCWAGPVILEIVGAVEPTGTGPSTVWGAALTCPDLDATVSWLGPHRCGAIRTAVQGGRRIATLRSRDLGVGTALAFMSPHVRNPPRGDSPPE